MFRRTFIRLILVIAVATCALLAFAAAKTHSAEEQASKEKNEQRIESTSTKSNFLILESIGLSMIKASSR